MDPNSTPPATSAPWISLAQKYSINHQKPFFPVNTMRLLYLLIADGLAPEKPEAVDRVNSVIPKISAIFDSRDRFLSGTQATDPLAEIHACRESLEEVFSYADTPVVRHTFDLLFSDLYPLQESLLLSLDRHLSEEKLSASDLVSILKILAMDSVVYSAVISQVLVAAHPSPQVPVSSTYTPTPLHWQINTTLQLNDLCDAVIHAKDDLDSGTATIIDIARRIGNSPSETVSVINQTLDTLLAQSQKLPFPPPLQHSVDAFNQTLMAQIKEVPPSTQS